MASTTTRVQVDSEDGKDVLVSFMDILKGDSEWVHFALIIVVFTGFISYLVYRYRMKLLESGYVRNAPNIVPPVGESDSNKVMEHNLQDHEMILKVIVDLNNKFDLLLSNMKKFQNDFKKYTTNTK